MTKKHARLVSGPKSPFMKNVYTIIAIGSNILPSFLSVLTPVATSISAFFLASSGVLLVS